MPMIYLAGLEGEEEKEERDLEKLERGVKSRTRDKVMLTNERLRQGKSTVTLVERTKCH